MQHELKQVEVRLKLTDKTGGIQYGTHRYAG